MRSFLLMLRIIVLGFLATILTLVGIFISNQFPFSMVWALVLWIAAFVCVFYIRSALPQQPRMDWKAEIIAIGLFALAPIAAWVVEWRDTSISANTNYPTFASLDRTTGVLKKGTSGNIYLASPDGSNLRLICAARGLGGGKGGSPDNWCLHGKEEPYLNKSVTVFHSPPFKISSVRANFYEIRSGNDVLIYYKDMIDLIKSDVQRITEFDPTLSAWLTIFWLYYIFETWIVKTRSRKDT